MEVRQYHAHRFFSGLKDLMKEVQVVYVKCVVQQAAVIFSQKFEKPHLTIRELSNDFHISLGMRRVHQNH